MAVALLVPACDEAIDADGNTFEVVHSADELRFQGEPEIVELDGYRAQIGVEGPTPDEGRAPDLELDFTDVADDDVSYYIEPTCTIKMNCETRTCTGSGNSICIKHACDYYWGAKCHNGV